MMLGLGVGGWAAGLFHLLTHAFFKALLFLGAGSVYHSVHTYEMPVLGGLLKKMPITAYTMLVGTLAISGVPFFSGFYSKDAILAAALARVCEQPRALPAVPPAGGRGDDHGVLHVPDVVPDLRRRAAGLPGRPRRPRTTGMTATHGPRPRHDHGNPADHAHESEPIMTWPLIILAVPSDLVGWTLVIGPAASATSRSWSRCSTTASRSGRDRPRPGALVGDGGLAPDRGVGHRAGRRCITRRRAALLRADAAEPGAAAERFGAGLHASSSTSGTSTSSTTPCFVRPTPGPGPVLRRVRPQVDRRRRQRLGAA